MAANTSRGKVNRVLVIENKALLPARPADRIGKHTPWQQRSWADARPSILATAGCDVTCVA